MFIIFVVFEVQFPYQNVPFLQSTLCPGILGIAGNDYIKTIETNETEGYGST